MTITEKTAYLKGLLEGMNIDQTTNEGKLLAAIIAGGAGELIKLLLVVLVVLVVFVLVVPILVVVKIGIYHLEELIQILVHVVQRLVDDIQRFFDIVQRFVHGVHGFLQRIQLVVDGAHFVVQIGDAERDLEELDFDLSQVVEDLAEDPDAE